MNIYLTALKALEVLDINILVVAEENLFPGVSAGESLNWDSYILIAEKTEDKK